MRKVPVISKMPKNNEIAKEKMRENEKFGEKSRENEIYLKKV